jgi:hypothetical protein
MATIKKDHAACLAVFSTPHLSAESYAKMHALHAVGAINWGQLWPLLVQYSSLAVQALEEVLPLVGVTTPWTTILELIMVAIQKLQPLVPTQATEGCGDGDCCKDA